MTGQEGHSAYKYRNTCCNYPKSISFGRPGTSWSIFAEERKIELVFADTVSSPDCLYTHPFSGPLSGTTRVSRYQKGKTNLDFTEARVSEWQWHQLGYMQVCISLQTDNHASTPPLSFLKAGCPSCRPTNSVKALKACLVFNNSQIIIKHADVLSKHSTTYCGRPDNTGRRGKTDVCRTKSDTAASHRQPNRSATLISTQNYNITTIIP